jgi:hypothetical protein
MRAQIILRTIGLSLALGVAGAYAAGVTPDGAAVLTLSDRTPAHAVHDLGLLPPPGASDNPTPAPSSASTASSAEPIPELPTWAMMLVFFMGLGLAGFKRGRKDRLSPGIQ